MALENPDVIEFEMEADVYTLRRTKKAVQLVIEGQVAHPDVSGAKIDAESGDVTIMGRGLGKVNAEVSGDVNALSEKLAGWFPPGLVNHAHSQAEFDGLNHTGIVVGKFSATWCGPCKMVAPAIDRLSLQYPDVTFIHVDEHEAKNLFQREKIQSYPTFKFWQNGHPVGQKVEGADAKAVEAAVASLGAQKVEIETNEADIVEEDVTLTCERDRFRIEKTEAGVSLTVNGNEAAPPGKCPHMEVNRKTHKVVIGRSGGKIYLGGGVDFEAIANAVEQMFPTQVKHIHSLAEFDAIVQNGITCAKFSAEWCGPCKQIAGFYHDISNKLEGKVRFLHIDVDECKALARREKVEAMPTFHFFVDGVKKTDMMVRGANIQAVVMNLMNLGVDVLSIMQ